MRTAHFGSATAAMMVLIRGLLSGCGLSTSLLTAREPGTIAVEVTRMNSTTLLSDDGGAKRRAASSTTFTTITETSGTGDERAVFSTASFMRPGYQQAEAGSSLELYDPADKTIYVTTEPAWEVALTRQMEKNEPKGSQSSSRGVTFTYAVSPGRTSVFEQQLHAHLYKVAGHVEVDGRAALKLTPTRRSVQLNPHSGVHELLGTVYVTPGTYDPIKEVIREPALSLGFSSTLVESWLVYKVLPATTANLRLVSLAARHPRARLIHSATGYLAASSSDSKGSPIIRVTSH